jgi:hypothetical protein
MAFGKLGAPMHRMEDFEGAGMLDGELQRDGLLVDPAIQLPTPGLILLHGDGGAYQFDGLYNANRTDAADGWSSNETEEVLYALCGEFNDRSNSMAHKYALYHDRAGKP